MPVREAAGSQAVGNQILLGTFVGAAVRATRVREVVKLPARPGQLVPAADSRAIEEAEPKG